MFVKKYLISMGQRGFLRNKAKLHYTGFAASPSGMLYEKAAKEGRRKSILMTLLY
jgi:hypothetical protein